MEIKSGKMVKSLEDFFKGYNKYFEGVFFFVSIGHLFENLESGKRNYWFGKKSEILDPKICNL